MSFNYCSNKEKRNVTRLQWSREWTIEPYPFADWHSFFGHCLGIGNIMFHYWLKEFIFILPIKWRLFKESKVDRTFKVECLPWAFIQKQISCCLRLPFDQANWRSWEFGGRMDNILLSCRTEPFLFGGGNGRDNVLCYFKALGWWSLQVCWPHIWCPDCWEMMVSQLLSL